MTFSEQGIEERYLENLTQAIDALVKLDFAHGSSINVKGLNGWVYEKTIRNCLIEEFHELGIDVEPEEQVKLGRARIDLKIGTVCIEIKAKGLFSPDAGRRYEGYRESIEKMGWTYLYLTRGESYGPYREASAKAFGPDRAFFLDSAGSWKMFVESIQSLGRRSAG